MRFDFKDGLDEGAFYYCYSPQAKACGTFEREENCIKNRYNEDVRDYEYTTAMLKRRLGIGDEITLECDFERRGAPLVVFTDELVERDGKPYYGEHYEVVAFEEGCNVWHNTPTGELDPKRALKTCKLHFESIPTPNRSRVTLAVKFLDGGIKVVMNGSEFSLDIPGMPKEFAFGITACEGINRLYSLTVESKNA